MNAGLNEEAERLYRKVYNLGLSLESQTAAALGAGKCLYEKKDFPAAAEWLGRYISLAGDRTSKDLDLAYFLLGKTQQALGNPQQACEAFEHTLAGQLSREEYIQTLSALVESRMQQGHFVEALDALESGRSQQLSQKDSLEILLFKSRVFRAMGLADKSIVVLGDKAEYISVPHLKAKILFELAECHIDRGDLSSAESILTESLSLADPGPLAQQIACELAAVCLKLSHNSQAISICSQLLDSNPPSQIKQKALNILAAAYNQQKDYDKAALAFLGYCNDTDIPNREDITGGASGTDRTLRRQAP
jgi:tetratricopeptide (TPR) repeat protein